MKWSALSFCFVWVACGGVERPTANPGPNERTVASGDSVDFDGAASRGHITEYRWNFGDDTEEQLGARVSHAFTTNGLFTVTLTVKGPGGYNTASVLVSVGDGCHATAVVKVTTQQPAPAMPVQFTAAGSMGCAGAALNGFDWDYGDGATDSGTAMANPTHTYTTAGTYTVTLVVHDERGASGKATRALGVGVNTGQVTVSCTATRSAEAGVPITLSASGADTGGHSLTYSWSFSDGSPNDMGATVTRRFATAGTVTATVIARSDDARTSEACHTTITVSAPVSYSGSWLLNPSSASLSGCTMWSSTFPAGHLDLVHSGTNMTGTPSGNGFPSGISFSGVEDAAPAAPGTFRLNHTMPDENHGACGAVTPDHSVRLTFTSPTTVSGAWTIVYTAACVGSGCPASCNCVATGMFTGAKQ